MSVVPTWPHHIPARIRSNHKWDNIIELQPVTVVTDHKALESWATETLDTPSGPAGRCSRWHEFLSKFDLTVEFLQGNVNEVADSLSRWAYPASQAAREVCKHGTWENKVEMEGLEKQEMEEERQCMVVTRSGTKYEAADSSPDMSSNQPKRTPEGDASSSSKDGGSSISQDETSPNNKGTRNGFSPH